MWGVLSQLSKGIPFRILLAVVLFIAVVQTYLPDLRAGPANVWQLVFDIGAIVGLVLILFSIWPPGEELLIHIEEAYHPYFMAAFTVFFLTWTLYLLSTGVEDVGTFVLALVLGLVGLVELIRWYSTNGTRNERTSS